MSVSKKLVGAAIAAAAGVALLAPATAFAGTNDNTCLSGDNCLYFNSNYQGAVAGFEFAVYDFAGYNFRGPGNGAGQPVKNNAASDYNNDPNCTVWVWYNHGYQGPADAIAPQRGLPQLQHTYNQNASQSWTC
ncbi:peptidase inhibitor family I36 protein [Kutzneria buriramensis]|uniref:Peptidase inhibitor family I36 n=1 Tax=Kutzneria buriramensis TaxID=1045776 RepID=A0A3E0H7Q6_9PSEU|nr:peptidase inhibitor family I36 protein [Kutzneria buriramensis]REH39469.1 peptidase inhibitor family I36 [Kutzneria buriramensis]